MADTTIPKQGTEELRRLEIASGWLCTCFADYTSVLCPFHAPVIPFPEIQINRGGIKWPMNP